LEAKIKTISLTLIERRWLSQRAFEIKFSRPSNLVFRSGQRLRFHHQIAERDYTPVSTPQDPEIVFCIRKIDSGLLTPVLSQAEIGTRFEISGPDGYFTFKPSGRAPVFVATGAGIAPFCSMTRSGVTGFTLLHGVDNPDDLYYAAEFASAADLYVPCISNEYPSSGKHFRGRVTDYLQRHLPPAAYDFYLCGRREMIRDVTWLVDEKFKNSNIYTETFY
jgi:benzoate/toluate 1,2-dioxygenase reductase component